MKKTVTMVLALMLCLAMFAAPASLAETSSLEPLDITFYLWGDKPSQMDDVLAEFHNRTKDTLNMNLSINWTPLDDYGNMIVLRLSAGESVDACFDAQWINLLTFIAEGNYTDLSEYFLNDQYPGLKAAFEADYLSNNKLGTENIYGIPFTQSFGTPPLVFIRGDLREKYGVPEVNSPETYLQYLDAIVVNEPMMVPYAAAPSQYNAERIVYNENIPYWIERNAAGVYDDIRLATGAYASLYIDDYQVKGVSFKVESSGLADFPEPYNQRDLKKAEYARSFYEKGYLDKDFLTVTDSRGQFTSGKAASIYWDTSNYLTIANALAESVPEAVLEVYQPNPVFLERLKGMIPGEYTAWNFLCIPVTTPKEKTDRIMMFYDWMYSSVENHDLIELGIEGKHFTAIGDDQYKTPDGVDPSTNYVLPGYQLTWNPNFIRTPADFPDDIIKYINIGNDPETYYDPLLSGFVFNGTDVQSQLSNPDLATLNSKCENIEYGLIANVEQAYAELDAEAISNTYLMEDLAVLREELIKQAQAYLDQRKVYDEANQITYPK